MCRRGDRSVGQVAKDIDLTETAVRDWVRQADIDAGPLGRVGQRRAGSTGGWPRMWRSSGGLRPLREGDPVNVYPFVEAEKKCQRRNVARAYVSR